MLFDELAATVSIYPKLDCSSEFISGCIKCDAFFHNDEQKNTHNKTTIATKTTNSAISMSWND